MLLPKLPKCLRLLGLELYRNNNNTHTHTEERERVIKENETQHKRKQKTFEPTTTRTHTQKRNRETSNGEARVLTNKRLMPSCYVFFFLQFLGSSHYQNSFMTHSSFLWGERKFSSVTKPKIWVN